MSLFDITPKNTIDASHLRMALVDHREVIVRLQTSFPNVYNYDQQIKELDQVLYYLDNAKTVALQVTECM